jgi:hypothetical protein
MGAGKVRKGVREKEEEEWRGKGGGKAEGEDGEKEKGSGGAGGEARRLAALALSPPSTSATLRHLNNENDSRPPPAAGCPHHYLSVQQLEVKLGSTPYPRPGALITTKGKARQGYATRLL